MNPRELPLFREAEAKKVFTDTCRSHKVPIELVRDLLDIQRKYVGSGRAQGITSDFEACLGEHVEGSER